MIKKILLASTVAVGLLATESNVASLTDIKESLSVLIKSNAALSNSQKNYDTQRLEAENKSKDLILSNVQELNLNTQTIKKSINDSNKLINIRLEKLERETIVISDSQILRCCVDTASNAIIKEFISESE